MHEIFRSVLKALGKWSLYDEIVISSLVRADEIPDISKGQQAADWMKSIRAWRADMQVEVDLGRRESEALDLG
jgi:hypothetical protein